MISSRCSDTIVLDGKEQKLSELRERLKKELESGTLFGQNTFQVWMNEHERAGGGVVWDTCMKKVREADIVLVLYNGHSGWCESGGVGICHAELKTALSANPGKVRLIELPMQKVGTDDEGKRHRRFREYVERQELIKLQAGSGDEVIEVCKMAVHNAVLRLTRYGAHGSNRSKFYTGDSLQWSRLDFEHRQKQMVKVLCNALLDGESRRHPRTEPRSERSGNGVFAHIDGRPVLLLCHAVPAAMGISAAREMLGQPFLQDYKCAELLKGDRVGPVHIIACHRSVTESQALKQLGFPDATVVSPPFGIYVADNIQKIQLAFIANCRDETNTYEGAQRLFEWLEQSDEDLELVRRATARRKIIAAIARENTPRGGE
ncbi:MAG: DUF4062 domain-containing protein [Pyrinomonadaceae bacterium]